jgi:hypothetical protein
VHHPNLRLDFHLLSPPACCVLLRTSDVLACCVGRRYARPRVTLPVWLTCRPVDPLTCRSLCGRNPSTSKAPTIRALGALVPRSPLRTVEVCDTRPALSCVFRVVADVGHTGPRPARSGSSPLAPHPHALLPVASDVGHAGPRVTLPVWLTCRPVDPSTRRSLCGRNPSTSKAPTIRALGALVPRSPLRTVQGSDTRPALSCVFRVVADVGHTVRALRDPAPRPSPLAPHPQALLPVALDVGHARRRVPFPVWLTC